MKFRLIKLNLNYKKLSECFALHLQHQKYKTRNLDRLVSYRPDIEAGILVNGSLGEHREHEINSLRKN